MTHRIFYGTDFKLTDSDKKMFSREGYECKDLLQGRAGLPVVVSQKKDKDFPIWKVQYGVSCLVFPTYEDAMDFCCKFSYKSRVMPTTEPLKTLIIP